jgi:hypothetical protein
MMRRAPMPPAGTTSPQTAADAEPTRLLRSPDAGITDLMKAYARRTRPGEHQSLAAWYRLRPLLDAGTPRGAVAAGPARWRGAGVLRGTLAAALILLVVVASGAARPAPGHSRTFAPPTKAGDSRRGVGPGGAAGWGELGAGGAEGSSGARVRGETATGDAPPSLAPRAG